MKALARTLFLLLLALSLPVAAQAQAIKTFAVLPFVVNGPDNYRYLSQAVQSMLTSRLNWDGHVQSSDRAVIDKAKPAKPAQLQTAEAKKILAAIGADYLVHGVLNIIGNTVNLEVHTLDRNGLASTFPGQSDLNGLIPALEDVAKEIGVKVFGRQAGGARPGGVSSLPGAGGSSGAAKPAINRMNPDLVFNETSASQDYYLNKNFAYTGDADSTGRWRSQALNLVAVGAVTGDVDGDGKVEVVVLTDHAVHVYRVVNQVLTPVASYEAALSIQCLNINLIDTNRDGVMEIVVSAMRNDDLASFILNFKDGKFTVVADRVKLFLNVVRIPPDYRYHLVAQKFDANRVFYPGVFIASLTGDKVVPHSRIALPEKSNVFNFAYLPDREGYKIIQATDSDKLRVFNAKNELLSTTEESYAGSALGIEYSDTVPGMGKPTDGMTNMYYVPARLLPISLQQDRFELITVHNISVAAQFFSRFRSYAQGEVHSLYFDGVGINTFWKTKRIKGTIVDYAVEDVTNDGVKDLFVCVVSYPGVSGFESRKTYLLSYTLDTSDPNTAK